MSVYYNFFKMCWDNQYIDADTIKKAVIKGRITGDEFKEITGEEYVA